MRPQTDNRLVTSVDGYVDRLVMGSDMFILINNEYVQQVVDRIEWLFYGLDVIVEKSNVPGFSKVSRQILPLNYWHSRTSLDRCYVDSVDAGVIWYYANTEDRRILTSSTIKDFLNFWMPDQQK